MGSLVGVESWVGGGPGVGLVGWVSFGLVGGLVAWLLGVGCWRVRSLASHGMVGLECTSRSSDVTHDALECN